MSKKEMLNGLRAVHPLNSKFNRKYFNVKFLTRVNGAGLYVERSCHECEVDDPELYVYRLKHICTERHSKIDDVLINAINIVDHGRGAEGFHKMYTLFKALTNAYKYCTEREFGAWHRATDWTKNPLEEGVYFIHHDVSGYSCKISVHTDPSNTKVRRYWL